ncbi:MAG: ribosome biogenesis GTP-binding protein YihA/YsxC [Pseudomonadales bacterium]
MAQHDGKLGALSRRAIIATGFGNHMRKTPQIQASFLTSADSLAGCPVDDIPEVAFAGRSNAGKSSTLNCLTRTRNLARVSKTPGRTQLINFFATNLGGRLVDLPGYGYAKASKSRRKSWGEAVDAYLERRSNLKAVALVMDIRHPLQPFDVHMIEWGLATDTPLLVLLNKADKLKQSARVAASRQVDSALAEAAQVVTITFSAKTGLGSAKALEAISEFLTGPVRQ